MNAHLEEQQLSAAVAGLDLDGAAGDHLQSCLACRRQVRAMQECVDARRQEVVGDEPDWQAQHAAIMARLPATGELVPIERHWRRPLLAAAASLVLALGATILYVQQREATPAMGPDRAEQILAEVEATLGSDEIPGFEAIGEAFFASDEAEDTGDTEESTAWDVALAVLEDDDSRYEVPGFEAMGMLVPSMAELESMITNHIEAS